MTIETKIRNNRKVLTGVVTSCSGYKTRKVEYAYKIPHPRYHKEINRKTVLHVHDENNDCAIGDKVLIMETRPMSKLKRFRLVKILAKAPLLNPTSTPKK